MEEYVAEATDSLPKEAGLVGLELLASCLKGMRSITFIALLSVNPVSFGWRGGVVGH